MTVNLNEWTAVHVMGWERSHENGAWMINGSPVWDALDEDARWLPTENIEQAMMLVEKMRDEGWDFELYSPHKRSMGKWDANLNRRPDIIHYGLGETPALTITQAVYEAKKDE